MLVWFYFISILLNLNIASHFTFHHFHKLQNKEKMRKTYTHFHFHVVVIECIICIFLLLLILCQCIQIILDLKPICNRYHLCILLLLFSSLFVYEYEYRVIFFAALSSVPHRFNRYIDGYVISCFWSSYIYYQV